MSKNWLALLFLLNACEFAPDRSVPEGYQGLIELTEQHLGFEVSGRLNQVLVEPGDAIQAKQELARVDSTLQRSIVAAQEAQVSAAKARLELLEAGTRSEEVRALAAQLRGAEANVQHWQKTAKRERALARAGATPAAALDDVEAQLARALAEAQSLQQRLAALRKGTRSEELKTQAAQLRSAEASAELENQRLQKYTLRAETAGRVVDVHFEAGEVVSPGVSAISVAETQTPYAEVFVPQGELTGIKLGNAASVRVDEHAEPFTGHVEFISPRTEFTPKFLFSDQERSNLVVRVRVRISDPTESLHAGVPAFVKFERS